MKLAIVGSRDLHIDERKLWSLVHIHFDEQVTEIVSGGATGIDTCAANYAWDNGLKLTVFEADWNKYGKSAGPRRNAEIVNWCDAMMVLWDGKSRGTKSSINLAKQAGKRPIIYVRQGECWELQP